MMSRKTFQPEVYDTEMITLPSRSRLLVTNAVQRVTCTLTELSSLNKSLHWSALGHTTTVTDTSQRQSCMTAGFETQ